RAIIPDWMFSLTNQVYIPFISPYLRKMLKAYNDLEAISMKAVSRMRADLLQDSGQKAPEGGALLRNLVQANENVDEGNRSENNKRSLTDRELLSNIFIFFLAGYETTATAVSFSCALLALYPEIQQKVFEEVLTLWPEGPPTHGEEKEYKQCFSNLIYTTAVFYEAIRLRPIVSRLGRKVLKDTILKTYRFTDKDASPGLSLDIEPITIPLKAGSEVIIDVQGVHRNPVYWGSNADEFNPEHFIDSDTYRWPRDAFLGFSTGHRNCIGQKFGIVEGVCILSNLIRKYEILIPADLKDSLRTFEEQKAYLLEWRPFLANVAVNSRVCLRLR
ncbi:cytochrome P450, partial [Dendrothele bispora CBS 962.96]